MKLRDDVRVRHDFGQQKTFGVARQLVFANKRILMIKALLPITRICAAEIR